MNSLKKDYTRLYLLQSKFLTWWGTLNTPFYLTGGTALGRFYLNHRYSEDLDFFANSDPNYLRYISTLRQKISDHFSIDPETTLFSDDFTRIMILEDNTYLKIEFVNDISYRSGTVKPFKYGTIDTPLNILSNKLTALIGRDEPKDIFDIVYIALSYKFNWIRIFQESKTKAIINELDVEERLNTFPVQWLENADWITGIVDADKFKRWLITLADDFLLGKDNSLCNSQSPEIENAPLL